MTTSSTSCSTASWKSSTETATSPAPTRFQSSAASFPPPSRATPSPAPPAPRRADRGSLRALLARKWTASDGMHGWLSWQPKTRSRRDAAGITYKLYISPRPERMRDAFDVVVRVLADFPGTPFKIGSGAIGLLRPDKFVAYFATRALLDDAADALRGELAGCDAHGVPFSAAAD